MATRPTGSVNTLSADARTALYAKVDEWHKTANKIAELQAIEKELRTELCNECFEAPVEGTNKFVLGFGKELKMTFRINRTVDQAALEAAISGQKIHPDIVSKVINYKPNLSVSGWKEIGMESRQLFAEIVEEKPGTPGLEIFTPKK